jgi:hypothetical protein
MLVVLSVPVAQPVSGQVRASESALVAQTVDGTRLTVEYYRPRARNRDSLFGKVVTWGEVWTPGANWATTLETSKDVTVNDKPVPAGKYSVWFVVRKSGPWTVVLDPRNHLFHMAHPDSNANQIRFDVRPETAPFSEPLTWSFREVRVDGATLALEWGTVRVPLDITVKSSVTLTTAAEAATPYLGDWSFVWVGPDSAKKLKLHVTYENGSLMGRWDPAPYPEWERFYLISESPRSFFPGFMVAGKLYEIERDMIFGFKPENGRATELLLHGANNEVMATGKWLP